MTINPYFNNYNYANTQNLVEDLVVECIRMYGMDFYYLPRSEQNVGKVFRDPTYNTFESAHLVEMYVKNTSGFGGDGNFLSKFGLEIGNEISLTVARRSFKNTVGDIVNLPRPMEGDAVYFPLNKKLFQITFVDHETIFYQMGSLQVYDITCELFEYSNEEFRTGITEIDTKYNNLSTSMNNYALLDSSGNVTLLTEFGKKIIVDYEIQDIDLEASNEDIQEEADKFLDFSDPDPWSEGGRF